MPITREKTFPGQKHGDHNSGAKDLPIPQGLDGAGARHGGSVIAHATGIEIRAAAAGRLSIVIYSEIGGGVSAEWVMARIQQAGTISAVDLYVNSLGGDVFDGQAIYSILRRLGVPITTYIDGVAASIATYIALAGNPVYIAENARFIIHEVRASVDEGTAADLARTSGLVDQLNADLRDVYAAKTGIPAAEIAQMMTEETTFSAAEAVAAGFCDQVISTVQIAAKFSPQPRASSETTNTEEPEMADQSKSKADLQAYVDEFGAEAGVQYYLAGMSLDEARADAQKTTVAELKQQVEELTAKLAEQTASNQAAAKTNAELTAKMTALTASLDGPSPVSASAAETDEPSQEKKFDVRAEHAALVAAGSSRTDAWRKLHRTHRAEMQAFLANQPRDNTPEKEI